MLRSTTNLVVPKHLQLPRARLKEGFLYVYGKGYTGPEPVFINRMWMSTFFPGIANSPSFGKNRKGLREWATYAAKHMRAGYLNIKKVNDPEHPHFLASIPLAEFNPHSVSTEADRLATWFLDGKTMSDALDANEEHVNKLAEHFSNTAADHEVKEMKVDGAKAIAAMNFLDANGHAQLKDTLMGLRLVHKGSVAVVFADFKISSDISQQLTTNEWMMIRPIDLYPLLLQWVAGQFGYKESAPLAAFPVSKIAKTLPPVQAAQIRINEYGLSIDPKGQPLWLPKQLDNTGRYEDLYSQVGDKGDGHFGLLDVDHVSEMVISGEEVKVKLPANIPVLIDWVNNKYSYTLSSGMLKVQDLSRFKAADDAHIHNILVRQFVTYKTFTTLVSMAITCNVDTTMKFKPEELKAIANDDASVAAKLGGSAGMAIDDYWETAEYFFQTHYNPDIFLKDINEHNPIFGPLSRFCSRAYAAILTNQEVVNTRYAVSTVSVVLGLATLLAKYATQFSEVELRSNALCSAALNQEVTEGWEPSSIPLWANKGMLPHQKKVRNLLKDSPDFAILPVQAGGGKSMLSVTDVLYEIKANRSQPYLILCPAHLVAQYVKEFVFFTAGKVNIVAINNYVVGRNGFERLTKMLDGAPRNTIVVADYDCLRGRQEQVCYGTTSVTVYPIIEFLRQFNFGYAMLDESHYVKNDSQRTRACMVLIADIPKKRLASGTMAHDSPSDLAVQIAMLDPTLFGSREEFNAEFGEDVKGSRVKKWKPGAQQKIMRRIKSRVVVAGAMRKEWAALLPKAIEKFHKVDLTTAQHQVYTAILTEALDKMKEDAKGNKTLQKFFESQGVKIKPSGDDDILEDEDDDGEDAADENAGEDLEALLGFYLARLEQYITAPTRDELGDKLLTGEDRRSPKVNKIIERMYEHLNGGYAGKILVFTNYTASAEEIYEALPPDLKAQALLYVAAEKVETGNVFENDPKKTIMIGVENSMNTGLNLQHVSRLIRVETVWNPGTLEQGNSRVNRPELKKAERREEIFYDWIMADRTLDITKISRLISKVIAVGKFENADDPAYENLPEVEIIPMNAEAIQMLNDWNANLIEYAEAYKEFKQVQADDYKAYKEKHGELKLEAIEVAPTPKDAKLMAHVPYTPGLEIYNAGELGLVRVDEYLRQDASDMEGDDDEKEDKESEMTDKQKKRAELFSSVVGKAVHTEFGDGIVKSVMPKSKKIDVVLPSGYLVRVGISAAFIVTRATTSSKDIRNSLLKAAGDMEITKPVDVLGPTFRRDNMGLRRAEKLKQEQEKERERQKMKVKDVSLELSFNVSNGFLGITYFVEKGGDDASHALQALGFRPVPKFAMAEVKSSRSLVAQFKAWEAKGFTLDESSIKARISEAFQDLNVLLKSGKIGQGVMNFKFASRNALKNFFRDEAKPSTSKEKIKPFPMIEDGKAYIVMQLRGQPAAIKAVRVKVPGVRWEMSTDSLVFYGLDLAHTGQKIKEIEAAGIEIANRADLVKEFKLLKKAKIRNSDDDGMHI